MGYDGKIWVIMGYYGIWWDMMGKYGIYLLVWMERRKHGTQPTKSIPLGQVRYGKIMLLLQCARNYESQLFHETSFWRSACFKWFYQETSSPNFFWIPRAKPFSPRLESICRCLEAKIPLAGLSANIGHKTHKFTAMGEGHGVCYLKGHGHQGTALQTTRLCDWSGSTSSLCLVIAVAPKNGRIRQQGPPSPITVASATSKSLQVGMAKRIHHRCKIQPGGFNSNAQNMVMSARHCAAGRILVIPMESNLEPATNTVQRPRLLCLRAGLWSVSYSYNCCFHSSPNIPNQYNNLAQSPKTSSESHVWHPLMMFPYISHSARCTAKAADPE